MIGIRIKVKNLDNVLRSVNNLAEKIVNPDEKLLRRLGDVGVEDIDQRFMTRGYGTWPELSPETIKRKGHDNILIDSGAMFASVRITSLQPHHVEIAVPYGGKKHNEMVPVYHQQGTRKMPQRKIIDVTSKLTSAIGTAAQLWISDMIKAFHHSV